MHRPVTRTAINIGAVYGIVSISFFILLYFAGISPVSPSSILSLWLPLIFATWGIRHYRNHENKGYISYGRAFLTGFLTIACGAFLYALLLYLTGKIWIPDLLDQYKTEQLKNLEMSHDLMKGFFTEKLFDMAEENIDKITLSQYAAGEFFSRCMSGVFICFIISFFLKRKPPVDLIE